MNNTSSTLLAAAAIAGLVAAAPANSMAMSSLPPEHVQGTVTYRTGGIGHDEAVAMRHTESQYPLSVEFLKRATPVEHLASVDVTISDAQGTTDLSAISVGPYLLAMLPAGKYTIAATHDGKTKSRGFVIAANKPEHLTFEWLPIARVIRYVRTAVRCDADADLRADPRGP